MSECGFLGAVQVMRCGHVCRPVKVEDVPQRMHDNGIRLSWMRRHMSLPKNMIVIVFWGRLRVLGEARDFAKLKIS